MPELPEVRTVSKYLNSIVQNKVIENVEIRMPKIVKEVTPTEFKNAVEKASILSVSNIGKWIIFTLSNDYKFVVHLRLEGKFRTKLEGQNSKHDHVVITFKDKTKLYFNDTRQFGTFHLRKDDLLTRKPLSTLAKEPQNTDVEWLMSKLKKKSIAIKSSLLDQTLVVGLGNIYVNEVLWVEKIHPNKPSNKITKKELVRLLKRSHEIMEASYELGGSTIKSYVALDQKEGNFQNFLQVHDKKGEQCKECGTIITKIKVGGRGTYLCTNCQVLN